MVDLVAWRFRVTHLPNCRGYTLGTYVEPEKIGLKRDLNGKKVEKQVTTIAVKCFVACATHPLARRSNRRKQKEEHGGETGIRIVNSPQPRAVSEGR